MYHATKSISTSKMRINTYCQDYSLSDNRHIHSILLKCDSIGEIRISQLTSLYQLVENKAADMIINILPTVLPQTYCLPLPPSIVVDDICMELGQSKISKMAADATVMKTGLLRLEPALKRFIFRELKESAAIEKVTLDCPLYYFLLRPSFPWNFDDNISDDNIEAAIPCNELSLKHAYALWEELDCRINGKRTVSRE